MDGEIGCGVGWVGQQSPRLQTITWSSWLLAIHRTQGVRRLQKSARAGDGPQWVNVSFQRLFGFAAVRGPRVASGNGSCAENGLGFAADDGEIRGTPGGTRGSQGSGQRVAP